MYKIDILSQDLKTLGLDDRTYHKLRLTRFKMLDGTVRQGVSTLSDLLKLYEDFQIAPDANINNHPFRLIRGWGEGIIKKADDLVNRYRHLGDISKTFDQLQAALDEITATLNILSRAVNSDQEITPETRQLAKKWVEKFYAEQGKNTGTPSR